MTFDLDRRAILAGLLVSIAAPAMASDFHPTNGWGYLWKQAPLYFPGDFHLAVGALANHGLCGQCGKETAVLDGEAGLNGHGTKQRQVATRIGSFAALRSQSYDAYQILTTG